MYEISPYFIERMREHGVPPSRGSSAASHDIQPGLRDYWLVIRRHSTLIATITLCCVLLVGLAVCLQTPFYTATAVILIDSQPPQVLDMKELMVDSSGSEEHDYYKTQYALLESQNLAAEVIHNLGLRNASFVNDSNRAKGLIGSLWSSVKLWAAAWLFGENRISARDPVRISGVDAALVKRYLAHLTIRPEFGTRLVSISFSTPDPKLSALMANAHAEAYGNRGMELRAKANQTAERFLEQKLVELRDHVEKSEAALNTYRHEKGIVEFSTESKNEILLKRLEDLNNALTQTETSRIGLESQVGLIGKEDYYSLPGVVGSSMVQELKPQLAALQAQYASMSNRYTLEYRPLLALKAKLDDTRARLDENVAEIVRSVKLQYRAAIAREKELQQEIAQEKARALALNDASLKDAILSRDVDTNRQLYESVLKRMKEMGVAAEVRATNVSVVDSAIPPASPSSPRKGLAIILSTVFGLVGAVGIAFFIEYFDDTFKTPEEIERYLRLPMLALVPQMSRLQNGSSRTDLDTLGIDRAASDLPAERDSSELREKTGRETRGRWALAMAREAYRTVRSQVLLSRAGEPPKTVLITSAVAGEGKSISAVNTAITFAHKGRRVLLIDADLRRARCHELLRCAGRLGLSEVLTGQTTLDEVISSTAITNLFFISAGAVPPDPPELLGSTGMSDVLSKLGDLYDHIIIDSAPVMPVSDSVVLSRHVDGVILIAGRATSKQLVKRACMRVGDVGGKILGVVLNQVGYRHAGYYPYNRYHNYGYYTSNGKSQYENGADGSARIVFD